MSTLLNIIWIFFFVLSLALGWVISGILCIVFIVTIPFSGACFELAGLTLAPFGKEVVERKHLNNATVPKPIASTLWIIFSGFWLYIGYLISGILMMCTVIGIPLGLQCFKIAKVSLNPYKYTLVDSKVMNMINNR